MIEEGDRQAGEGQREEGDERLVDLEIWGENQRGAISSKGIATIRLPYKQTTN